MSNMFSGANASLRGRSLPDGETVGRYGSYLDAQKAVDYLADHDFPVQHVSIVGNDLKSVEVVTGKLSYPRVALSGAASGAMFGLFIGLLFSLFGGTGGLGALIPSVLIGAVFWMIIGVVSYAMQRGRRDFSSTSQVIASSFDVVVDREVAGQARNDLQNLQVRQLPTDQRSSGTPAGGQQYGGQQYGGPQGRPPAGPGWGGQQPGPWGQPPAGRPFPQGQPPQGQPPQGGQVHPGQQQGRPPQPGPWGPPQPGQPPANRVPQGQAGAGGPWGPPPRPGQPGQQQSPTQGGPYTGPAYQPQGTRADEADGGRRENGPHEYGSAPSTGGASPEAGPERVTPRGQFPDLPDGRPQYGVRVEQEPGQHPGPDQDSAADAPAAAGATAAGASAAGGRRDHDERVEDRVTTSSSSGSGSKDDPADDDRLAEQPSVRPGAAADEARPAETSVHPVDSETGAVTEGDLQDPPVNREPNPGPEQRDR